MRYLIPTFALFSFVLFTGCTTTTTSPTESSAHTCCAKSPTGQCVDCPACSAGKDCPDCVGQCTVTGQAACATCAAGEQCAECDMKKACTTCAAGEACAECAAKKDKSSDAAPATTAEPVAVIDAKGMGCPLCASSADRRLMKVDGVTWTKIDLGNGQVTVGLDPNKPTPAAEDLQAAVRDAGFTADKVTLPEGEVAQ